ncbi:MAG TPA: DUF4288 domain-containing protein [Bacteroidia bacterium]
MNKIFNSGEWKIDPHYNSSSRRAEVSIYFKPIELDSIRQLSIEKRKQLVNQDRQQKLKSILDTGLFEQYELLGNENNPIGIKAKIPFIALGRLKKHKCIGEGGIIIHKLEGAKRVRNKHNFQYYCMKMTAVLDKEISKEEESIFEERYVLIKAKSFEDAYNRIKKQEKNNSEPYLNSDYELARWRIESYDDCFLTDIHNFGDISDTNGAVVYSILERRKIEDRENHKENQST